MQERRGWIRRALDETPAPAPQAATGAAPAAERATTIEHGCEIEGTFQLPGPLVVDGHFRGAIECRDSVTVREQGSVEARIRGRSVEIRGAVVGDVEAQREVVLRSGARLHGDVKTPSLVVERGAFWTGRTEMYRPQAVVRDRGEPARAGEAPQDRGAPGASTPRPSASDA